MSNKRLIISLVVDVVILIFWGYEYCAANNDVARQWIRFLAIATFIICQISLLVLYPWTCLSAV